MPSSYIVMFILAVVCIILSLKWMKNANYKGNKIEESKEWARKWNAQWDCDNKCDKCDERQECPFNEVKE